jgi:hypothetical protein
VPARTNAAAMGSAMVLMVMFIPLIGDFTVG